MTLPAFDFETYSAAGYYWDPAALKWRSVVRSNHGLPAVGAVVYTEHPSAEVMSLAFDVQDGRGPQLWVPGMPPPQRLFAHIAAGGLLEAWNSAFEYWVWRNICHPRLGWPPLPLEQLRCCMAKARAYALPGALGNAADVLDSPLKKLKDGKRLVGIFGRPHDPTQRRKRLRILPDDAPTDAAAYYTYNIRDIQAEAAVSERTPELSPSELDLWLLDQRINAHGVPVDRKGLRDCIAVVGQTTEQYTTELRQLTDGAVGSVNENKRFLEWLNVNGANMPNLQETTVTAALAEGTTEGKATRALEIRAKLGASSVKKLFAMDRMVGRDGRLHDLLVYCGADRTGRWAGYGPQPQNLPKFGPPVQLCDCGRHYGRGLDCCPWCGCDGGFSASVDWGIGASEDALTVIGSQQLGYVEQFFGDALATVSGCLRALFVAEEGYDLICSDYSAIEAVVLAMLSGEQWRIDVFRTHGKIYEESASRITGVPFAEFMAHRKRTGQHHPLRNKIGKFAELASGFGGWLNAWKRFGAGEHLTDDEIEAHIRKWREQSPMIVAFWRGLEAAAFAAVRDPGRAYQYRSIAYQVSDGNVLHCKLPGGRLLSYHQPHIIQRERYGRMVDQLAYYGWNTDSTKGPRGWIQMLTYGGKQTENVVQAVARDLLAHAMLQVDRAGYQLVLTVHDEPVAMAPKGWGGVDDFERLMMIRPAWAANWPIVAKGGWRGRRFRKS